MSKSMAYMGIVMGGIISVMAVILIAKPDVTDIQMLRDYHVAIGGIFLIYGLFRLYRSVLALKDHRDQI